MIGGELLFDTCAFIPLLSGDAAAREFFALAEGVVICPPVWSELQFGALKSGRSGSNLAKLEILRRSCRFVTIDERVGELAARLRVQLEEKKIQVPPNDVWIAAAARHYELPVVTFDRHFEQIPGLQLVRW